MSVLLAQSLRLAVTLIVTLLYWKFVGFCCRDWENAKLSQGVAGWFFIAAAVIFLSLGDLKPGFLCIYEPYLPVFNVFAALLCVHIIYCFLWLEFLSLLSMILCKLDSTAKHYRWDWLLDNKLITLKPEGGYISLFTFLAFLLLVSAIFTWYKMIVDLNVFSQWASCEVQRTGRSIERALNEEFENYEDD